MTTTSVRALLGAAVGTALLVSVAPAATAAPTYSPWSDSYYGLSGRVSPPSASQAKVFAQVRRSTSSADTNAGDRQVRLFWKIGSRSTQVSSVRAIAKGGSTTFKTGAVPCGTKVRVTISARGRATSSSAWSDWRTYGYTFTRSC